MARVVLSSHSRQPVAELRYASNIVWRKALNSIGYASFDLPLTDPFCTPTYLNPGMYVHIFSDSTISNAFAAADWGGQLCLDYEVKPKDGIVTCRAAGMANMLNVSIVQQTTVYTNLDVGSIVEDIIENQADNSPFFNLTSYTQAGDVDVVQSYQVNFGDNVYNDIEDLVTAYNCDFEVRPDFSWAFYNRQGVDNPNLVARYGQQGNVQVDSTMTILNSELFNKVYVYSESVATVAFLQNQTSINEFGPFSEALSADQFNTFNAFDETTIAQNEILRTQFPPTMMDSVVLVNTPLLPFNQLHLGDGILFEAPASSTQAISLTQQTPTPLVLGLSKAPSLSLPSAAVMTTTVTTGNLTTVYTTIGTATGYSELYSQGTTASWAGILSPNQASGNGFLYDTLALQTTQLVPGLWSQVVRLNCSAANGLGITGTITARWFVYHQTSNTYTPIGSISLSNQVIATTFSTYTLPNAQLGGVTLGMGDKLYMDCWVNATSNSTGVSTAKVGWDKLSPTSGVGGSTNQVLTPGYSPFRVLATPNLPMLQTFNGIQRILAIDYDDRKQTMTLSLGNAVYKIVRGRLHEVKLYQ